MSECDLSKRFGDKYLRFVIVQIWRLGRVALSRHKRFRPHVLPAFLCTIVVIFEGVDDDDEDEDDENDDEEEEEEAFQTFGNASMTSNVTTTVGH